MLAERYILGAFPDGYEMWEHVHGVWVLPNASNTPTDPRLLSPNGDGGACIQVFNVGMPFVEAAFF